MANNEDSWVQIFDIPDTSKHKKGFTIYKIISMLYPKACPDSVTKVTVWKRYNDFKKLHREMKQYAKMLKLNGFPGLPNISYFHRFDDEVIQQRKAGILYFLEYISLNRLLYTSDICVQFFKTSHTPSDIVDSNIQLIRAELNLPIETEYSVIRIPSDDDHTLSDTDSLSTLSSFQVIEHLPDPLNFCSSANKPTKSSALKNSHKSSDTFSISVSSISLDPCTIIEEPGYPTPPHTPNSAHTDGFSNYIQEASVCIEKAIDFEVSRKYEEAFNQYKAGIEILLKHVKDDKNIDIKDMIRHKIEKYLLRAEKIFNLYLSRESQTVRNYTQPTGDLTNDDTTKQSESELYNYKVLRTIGCGMLVLHIGSQQLYYVKVIQKTSKFSNDELRLPGNVPYMVKLCNYYNCENAIFLVLEFISGCNLKELMQRLNSDDILQCSFSSNLTTFSGRDLNGVNDESSDSEHSYSDLIYDYTLSKIKSSDIAERSEDISSSLKKDSSEEHSSDNLINSSNRELKICRSLSKSVESEANTSYFSRPTLCRKSSERSEWSCFDDCEINENVLLSISDITKWAAQLLLALERLHSLGIVCGDLQMKNLLINESGDLTLTYMYSMQDKNYIFLNNRNEVALAPELYGFQPVHFAVDWWSYGAILYEMLVGMPLDLLYPEGFNAFSTLKMPKYVSLEGRSLLRQLLVYDPHERLGAGVNGSEDIKTHPFFSTVSWDVLSEKVKST
ncbi:hypothetical protein PPYR_01516 [Photinus pyralis]|uniref:Protein kinase domain-containing protein n=1 Tax=Photinus pyralis TaxID=7054 RepID=A0A1Y1M494_PHOPY|nr:ribosomal protein S6 kinase delta-1 [Photinus pyralis]KAB0804546.1 hypothetical protein PPYR_01516 [Photinus pyralis]